MAASGNDGTANTFTMRREARRAQAPEKRPRHWRRRLSIAGGMVGFLILVGIAWAVWFHLTFVPTLTARVNSAVLELAPRVTARLLEIHVTERDVITKGQILARLDDRELQAALRAAEADLALGKTALAVAQAREDLARSRFEAEVAVARTAVLVAKTEVASLEADLEARQRQLPMQIREASARLAEKESELARLQAGSRPEEIESARERVASAKATLALSKLEVEQSQELVSEGIDSRYILEVRKTRLETQKHALKQAELALKMLLSGAYPEEIHAAEKAVERERAALEQVKLGEQQLAKLARDIEVRKARLKEAEALLLQAEAKKADVAVAVQQTKGAEAEVQRLQAMVEGRKAALEYTEIRSPVAGIVTRVYVHVGELCRQGVMMIMISDTSKPRWIDAFVDEEDARLVSIGQKAMMAVPANSFHKIETRVTQIGLHTATLDRGAPAPQTAFNEPDRVWVKLEPVKPLDPTTVTGTTARGRIRVR